MVQEQLPHKRRHTAKAEPKQHNGKPRPKTTVVKKETKKPGQKEGKDKTIETENAAARENAAAPETPTEPNT